MKKGFNIAANVCAIVLVSLLIIGAIVVLGGAAEFDVGSGLVTGIMVGIILFCVATIVVASLALVKLSKNKAFGFQIAVIVLIGILTILEFVGGAIVYGILCLIPIAFEIVAMCLPNKPAGNSVETSVANSTAEPAAVQDAAVSSAKEQTTDEKIAELKHLKELNVIDEEQYNKAVQSIFDNIK